MASIREIKSDPDGTVRIVTGDGEEQIVTPEWIRSRPNNANAEKALTQALRAKRRLARAGIRVDVRSRSPLSLALNIAETDADLLGDPS